MRVIIHSCDKRLWYVREFLAPALRAQGITPSIHNDDHHKGCLWAYIDSFRGMPSGHGGAWHIEDDVFPCRDFAKVAEAHDRGIVHGFLHRYGDEPYVIGRVPISDAGYSFPCFRLPNRYAREFAEWFLTDAQHRDSYKRWIEENKHVDSFMLNFLREVHPNETVWNLSPSIVEHVDEYIGGSVVNHWRDGWCKADNFTDTESIEELRVKLAERKAPPF